MPNDAETDPVPSLIEVATQAGAHAYIPYSQYRVGAALRAADGRVYGGCNIENASYPAGICAERVALVKAISDGVRAFDLLVVRTRDGGAPCGICRQMLSEFTPAMRVVLVREAGDICYDGTLEALLPLHFSANSVKPGDDGAY
jgi:cytidine deaminase